MIKQYDELTGKALRKVNKAKKLIEKYLFNFDGNQEVINWMPSGPGIIDFQGYDPISQTVVDGGFEYNQRGQVKAYVATAEYEGIPIPALTYGVKLKGYGLGKHVKAADKQSQIAASIISEYQAQWRGAAFELANWLDDLPGAKSRKDDSTFVRFEGFETMYA